MAETMTTLRKISPAHAPSQSSLHAMSRDKKLNITDIARAFVGFEALAAAASLGILLLRPFAIGWDTANYELIGGYGMVHGLTTLSSLPGQLQTYTDLEINALYYLLFAHLSVGLMSAAIALLESLGIAVLMTGIYGIARHGGAETSRAVFMSVVAGLGGAAVPTYVTEIGGTSSDTIVLFPLLLGLVFLYRAASGRLSIRGMNANALAGGICLGIALVLKFTDGPWVVALALGFAVAMLVGRQVGYLSIRSRISCLAVASAGMLSSAAALYLPVGVFLWNSYRDPLFPYYGKWFSSPFLKHANFGNASYSVKNVQGALTHITGLVVGSTQMTSFPVRSPIIVVGAAVAVVSLVANILRHRDGPRFLIEIGAVAGFIVWLGVFGDYRYLAVLEIVSPALLIALAMRHHLSGWLVPGAVAIVTSLALLVSWYPITGNTPTITGHPTYFGITAKEWRFVRGDRVVLDGTGPLGFIDLYLPPGTKVTDVESNLFLVMNTRWWRRTAEQLAMSRRPLMLVDNQENITVAIANLKAIHLRPVIGKCRDIPSRQFMIAACHLRVGRSR